MKHARGIHLRIYHVVRLLSYCLLSSCYKSAGQDRFARRVHAASWWSNQDLGRSKMKRGREREYPPCYYPSFSGASLGVGVGENAGRQAGKMSLRGNLWVVGVERRAT